VAVQPAAGQNVVVQLPTFRSFAVSTTVVVPDRGTAHLGGVTSSRVHRTRTGAAGRPIGGALGRDRDVAGAQVGVWIHDFEAMDKALLAEGAALRDGATRAAATNPPALRFPRDPEPLLSVAEIRRRRALSAGR
jgi:hypothetical protein